VVSNDLVLVQRQRRCATEPRVPPSGATLGYLFQIITNPEWGCALIHGSVRRNPFRVHGGMGWLTQGRRSFLAPTLGSVTERRWRSLNSAEIPTRALSSINSSIA